MKKTLLIIVFSVCGCLLAGADLQAGTVGAGGTAGSREVFTIGEAAVGLKTGLVPVWRALYSGNPSGNYITINSSKHLVHQLSTEVNATINTLGSAVLSINGLSYASQTISSLPTTWEATVSVPVDKYKSAMQINVGSYVKSFLPKIYGQRISFSKSGQVVSTDYNLFCGIGMGTTVNLIIENIGDAQTVVLKTAASNSALWKYVVKDGTTDITSNTENSGDEISLSSAQKYTSISVVLMPLEKSANSMQLGFTLSTKGYANNYLLRNINAQAGVEPNITGAGSSAAGYNKDTGKTSLYFVINPQASGASITASQETMATLYVFNLAGKLVYQQEVAAVAGYNLVDMPSLGRGTYIYQLVSEGKILYSGRFVNI